MDKVKYLKGPLDLTKMGYGPWQKATKESGPAKRAILNTKVGVRTVDVVRSMREAPARVLRPRLLRSVLDFEPTSEVVRLPKGVQGRMLQQQGGRGTVEVRGRYYDVSRQDFEVMWEEWATEKEWWGPGNEGNVHMLTGRRARLRRPRLSR